MAQPSYHFRPLRATDLALIRRWLAAPHVVETGGAPFGYLQCCGLGAWPSVAFGRQPRGARAIDRFIGEPRMVDRGHGSSFISCFVEELLSHGTPRVITDPAPENCRAIRAYQKAGFVCQHVVETRKGPALLMLRDR